MRPFSYTPALLTPAVEKIRQFKFDLSRGWKKNEEIIPPPILTNHVLPFNWGWHQNPNIIQTVNEATGESGLLNRSRSRKYQIEYLSHDVEDTPQKSPFPVPDDPDLQKFVEELKEALDERPLWTRRALANRVGNSPYLYLFKSALQYVGYQFKGGPFRDAVIRFGIDPRKDSKYRDYQTIFFKLYEEEEKAPFRKWHDNRTMSISKRTKRTDLTTHLFDGKSLTLDGKIWQFCDITDPLLAKLVRTAPVAAEFDSAGAGWLNNGSWAKIRAVMKLKLTVIRLGKTIEDEEFEAVIHKVPDIIDANKKMGHRIGVPLPDIKFTDAEREKLKTSGISSFGGSKWKSDFQGKARKSRLRDRRVAERKAKSEPMNTTPDLMPSIETAEAESSMIQDGGRRTRGAGQRAQVGTVEGAEAGNYSDLDDEDESNFEDEDFDDGESDDDRSMGDEDAGNGSDAEM
jgi:general transcription factor 3C polypeptide 5 (transcription factor C subunit 1)